MSNESAGCSGQENDSVITLQQFSEDVGDRGGGVGRGDGAAQIGPVRLVQIGFVLGLVFSPGHGAPVQSERVRRLDLIPNQEEGKQSGALRRAGGVAAIDLKEI